MRTRNTAISRRCGLAKPSDPARRCARSILLLDDAAVGAQVPPRRRPRPVIAMHSRHHAPASSCLTVACISARQLAEPADLRLPLGRRCSSRSRSAAACSSALVSVTAPGHRRGQRLRPGRRPSPSSSVGRHDGQRSPMLTASSASTTARSRRSPAPAGSQQLDQRFCSRQVGDQAERRLLHAELRVVGDHPQVARSASWKPAPMAWPCTAAMRDELRVAQPGEAALVAVDRLDDRLVARAAAARRPTSSPACRRGRASRRSSPAREATARSPRPPRPARRRAAPRRSSASACHIAGVWRCAPRAGPASPSRPAPSTSRRRPALRRARRRESCRELGHAPTRRRVAARARSGQRDQVGVVVVPEVLDAVGQDQHPVGLEGVDGALVVGDQDDRAGVRADRARAPPRGRRGRGCWSARRAAARWRSRRPGSPARAGSSRRRTAPRPACRRRRRRTGTSRAR